MDESVTDYFSRHDEKITIYQHSLEPFDMWHDDEYNRSTIGRTGNPVGNIVSHRHLRERKYNKCVVIDLF